jgi:glycosyltransferase involved in cell wall biosynthesis
MGTGTPAIDALRKMGAAENKLVNFPYWIDTDVYNSKPMMQSVRSNLFIRFVSSGRVINILKGHDLAIRGLAMAFKKVPEVNFEYFIAGTGPDSEKLMELSNKLGIGERVKILGWVEPNDLINVLQNSDVLIHPSPIHEPYGVAVIEAMAAGLIVLASDATCAALDRIKHGINGFIHSAKNLDELSAQIIWLFKHPERIPLIKSEARKTAEQWRIGKSVEIINKILRKCAA